MTDSIVRIIFDSLVVQKFIFQYYEGVTIANQAYCFKCRKRVDIVDAQSVTLKNGRPATKGTCAEDGTKVFRIGSK